MKYSDRLSFVDFNDVKDWSSEAFYWSSILVAPLYAAWEDAIEERSAPIIAFMSFATLVESGLIIASSVIGAVAAAATALVTAPVALFNKCREKWMSSKEEKLIKQVNSPEFKKFISDSGWISPDGVLTINAQNYDLIDKINNLYYYCTYDEKHPVFNKENKISKIVIAADCNKKINKQAYSYWKEIDKSMKKSGFKSHKKPENRIQKISDSNINFLPRFEKYSTNHEIRDWYENCAKNITFDLSETDFNVCNLNCHLGNIEYFKQVVLPSDCKLSGSRRNSKTKFIIAKPIQKLEENLEIEDNELN